ncbi:MAG TPA: tetratricopeptide repeat protein [Bryobacteraceae bacterium]|jgi:Flp pilus assembly protein TadD/mono/diheme cytochrome c family protein
MKCLVSQLKWALWLAVAGSAAAATPQSAINQVTFNQNIAPIVYQNCAPCHRPGESAPFSLLSFDDAKRHAMQIADVTKRRYMPPWLPEAGKGDFQEERRLTDAQIQLIQDWVKDGAPEGSAEGTPAPPKFSSEWQLGPPDLILHVGKPYELYAEGPEIFWNFILPVPVKTTKWVKAMAVRPGNPRVFHHANVILDRSGSSLRQEVRPGEGFAGMDLTVEEHTFDPDGHFLSWKPGSQPVVEPDGMAWRADPGMYLVLNVHLRPSGTREIVNPEIGLYFTDKPQTKFPMLLELEHDGALDIPPGDRDFVSSDDFHVPMNMNVLAVYPHAHYLCKLMEGYATLPDGTRRWLIRIPNWDLNWQGVYNYKQPVFLPKGSVISMRYHYDNSSDNPRNPSHPPKRVRNGNEALDEMGDVWLQVLPVGDQDQRAVLQEAVTKQRLEKYPTDFVANFDMGDLLLNQDKAAEAIAYFERACQAQPTSPLAASELGVALVNTSKMPEAREQFRRALQLDPRYTDARYNLASVEARTGEWEAAASDFKEVTVEKPDNAKAKQHLGEVMFLWGDDLAKSGDDNQAVLRYRDALVYRPDDPDLHTNLGMALARVNQIKEAQAELEAAVRIDPNSERAKQALAAIQRQ